MQSVVQSCIHDETTQLEHLGEAASVIVALQLKMHMPEILYQSSITVIFQIHWKNMYAIDWPAKLPNCGQSRIFPMPSKWSHHTGLDLLSAVHIELQEWLLLYACPLLVQMFVANAFWLLQILFQAIILHEDHKYNMKPLCRKKHSHLVDFIIFTLSLVERGQHLPYQIPPNIPYF